MYLKISRQGLTGARELRKRVRPFRAASFQHRPSGVLELPQAGSPLTGGKFSAEPQRGDSPSADGGNVAAPAAGAKRKGHLRFPFLFGLLPFPNITREQLAAMLYRYAGEPDGAADLSAYTDAGSVSAYAEKAVQWCVKNGILTGKTSSTLAPEATATRAECAAMLQRFAAL